MHLELRDGPDEEAVVVCETPPLHRSGIVDNDATNAMLLAAGRGDERAFSRFFDATVPHLTALLARLRWSDQQVEQVLEHAYVSAWQLAPLFTPVRRCAMLWLFVIACSAAASLA